MSDEQREKKPTLPEVAVAAEKVQFQNMTAVVAFAQDTRRIVREAEARVDALQNIIMTQKGTIENLQKQMAALQQIIYAGGLGE